MIVLSKENYIKLSLLRTIIAYKDNCLVTNVVITKRNYCIHPCMVQRLSEYPLHLQGINIALMNTAQAVKVRPVLVHCADV